MEKLECKYVSPHLPYGLKVIMEGKKTNIAWISTKNIAVIKSDSLGEYKKISWENAHLNIKPILRPLSDLSKRVDGIDKDDNTTYINILEEQTDGSNHEVEFIDHIKDFDFKLHEVDFMQCPYRFIKILLAFHFDIDGLIPEGLAVDINTLKLQPI